ncbi:class I SAM-dependent methyltransferase [Tengunoibacter tsumagoiensis]|uniref:Methyltransferase domain-containing protein n=1 Tax=Tengunoibacter tsumagoiensis TaxID=2014871 RepID=A0A402AAB1_9CHLR|nr:class I SAM-dependent methyltransferase [Tengunoibacter tsumagoiensis]GCE16059.1 hypothetical protein KTT_59180 [Tengunoibacter tsumagoiensis]
MNFFSRFFARTEKKQALRTEKFLQRHNFSPDAPYMLPKHLQEINRLDFQHYLLRYAFQGLYLAPVQQPLSILDVACGTGRWLFETAQEHPQAQCYGIDLTPPAPQTTTIPFTSQCHFVQGNILEGLPFPDESFDFVHQRFLILALPLHTWPDEVKELVRVTRRGGWIELVEVDLSFNNKGPAGTRVYNWFKAASEKRGIDLSVGRRTKGFLLDAGLQNVNEQIQTLPFGNWGGRMGSMLVTDLSSAISSIKPLITTTLNISSREYDETIALWIQEAEKYYCTYDFNIVYGQRL